MAFYVPFQIDLRKTETNMDASPFKYIQTILAIAQHICVGEEVLIKMDREGKMKRYMTTHKIPKEILQEFSVKAKNNWKMATTMFATIETMMISEEMKKLHGIFTLNEHRLTLRADRYKGEFTESVEWLYKLHPSLTQSVTLTETLEKVTSQVKLTKNH